MNNFISPLINWVSTAWTKEAKESFTKEIIEKAIEDKSIPTTYTNNNISDLKIEDLLKTQEQLFSSYLGVDILSSTKLCRNNFYEGMQLRLITKEAPHTLIYTGSTQPRWYINVDGTLDIYNSTTLDSIHVTLVKFKNFVEMSHLEVLQHILNINGMVEEAAKTYKINQYGITWGIRYEIY